ncbi:adenylyl-sulfate kinase [Dactylosporangium sp. CA-139066]|uniref:adenylyl-sulfate kinase n=1 Tax=Dactylosporangium sp. CA-139066 TaxID=3239930 RepID=UPI003D8B1981
MTAPGLVVWITGLSGVGKTTVSRATADRIAAQGVPPVLLDGDRLRAALPDARGYDPASRRTLAECYARLALEFSSQGHLVLCSTISLFHSIHSWNRSHFPAYLEVWLRAPLAELRGRRAGLLHAAGADHAGSAAVVGLDIPAEFPLCPDLVIDNCGETTAADAADEVYAAIHRRTGAAHREAR